MPRNALLVVLLALMVAGMAGCRTAPASEPVPLPDYWPTQSWRTGAPESHGFDPDLSQAIASRAGELPFLDGLLIIRNGYVVHESYYNGYDAAALHDIASVTKSWASAAVGKAQAEGLLSSIDAPLPVLLPQYFDGAAAAQEYADKRTITLRQLLQMRSGLAFNEDVLNTGGYGGEELLEENLTAMALGFPVAHPPGESWNYSTLDTQLISAIVQEAAGEPLAAFTAAHLFAPLGVETFEWSHDGAGTTIGGQNLSMTPRDMAKLGLLYLHGGAWEGNQLVPNEWVTLSLTPQNERLFFPPSGQVETIDWYGYHWYTWKGEWFFGYRSFQAAGYGGQQVLVFPELNLIIVTTANLAGATPDTDVQQRTALNELILEVIFPALADVELGLPASP